MTILHKYKRNFWDAMEREGKLVYNEVHFPRVLGGECAGMIAAVGDGVERFAVGDRCASCVSPEVPYGTESALDSQSGRFLYP
ncbi:MAG: alcohol dehydrogenase catalytic domain-containing protein [Nostoc sp.]|uniref:alcohol dehydrogenase catalytic domain-containing protein n=1 Tax=Nostoc sp. TaxID=1180 RepID=UPI002FF74E7B